MALILTLKADNKINMREFERQSALFYKQSAADLNEAKNCLRFGKGETCILLCVQAAVNRLNAVCVSFNRYNNPTYNLTDMLKICTAKIPDFDVLKEDCEFLDSIQDYRLFDEHAKGGKRITKTVMEKYYQCALRVLSETYGIIQKQRLFEPDVSGWMRLKFLFKHRSMGV